MDKGQYVMYDEKPPSDATNFENSQSRSVERKNKRKVNRSANELQDTLNKAQIDNDTDSIKYERKVKEPRLLRYVATTDVEQNFVDEKFESFDCKTTDATPRRYVFTKKPKNHADGSIHYAYSRSSSACSSPNGNLPTISEHAEQYGTFSLRAPPSPPNVGYDHKLDKYFSRPRELKNFNSKGSHPDSLYRVPTGDAGRHSKSARAFRLLRWPAALIIVCIALGTFVYFLMPDTNEMELTKTNKVGAHLQHPLGGSNLTQSAASTEHNAATPTGAKTSEIDFYDTKADVTDNDLPSLDTRTESNGKRKLPIPPIFPSKIVPEVQYGNERADTEKGRASNVLTGQPGKQPEDSTLKPHITQKPEKPLAIYFKNGAGLTTTSTETFLDAETNNDFIGHKKTMSPKSNKENIAADYSVNVNLDGNNKKLEIGTLDASIRFTSGHSNLFGISIEDAEKLRSTTQSSIYNTRVSPTLPVWREGDTTTNKYPLTINVDAQPQCQSTQLAQCRGVLPYDLTSINSEGIDVSSYLPHFEYMFSTNCSLRLKQFACVLMEPECNAPPLKSRKPCYHFCKSVMDGCEDRVPQELVSFMQCEQYANKNCVKARSPCFDNEMLCGDSSCIPRDWKCDGKIDCPTGEDEAKCGKCGNDQFQCPAGECILKRWLCDGYDDCAKGEDETERACQFVGSQKTNKGPRADLGEEFSGSAPAPSVRRPNQPPPHRMRHPDFHKAPADDNSRELLMTSDTGHPYRRNYTRRPPASRLTPYKRPVLYDPRSESSVEILKNSTQPEIMKTAPKIPKEMRPYLTKSKDDKTRNKMNEEENEKNTEEDVNIGDINFLADYQKRVKKIDGSSNKPVENQKFGRAPGPPPEKTTMKSPTRLDKSINKFEIEIDGMEIMKKKAKETPKFVQTDSTQNDDTFSDTQKKISNNEPRNETSISAHASPCPIGELRCVDGRCITLAQLCDGTIDCTDHADEDNCYT